MRFRQQCWRQIWAGTYSPPTHLSLSDCLMGVDIPLSGIFSSTGLLVFCIITGILPICATCPWMSYFLYNFTFRAMTPILYELQIVIKNSGNVSLRTPKYLLKAWPFFSPSFYRHSFISFIFLNRFVFLFGVYVTFLKPKLQVLSWIGRGVFCIHFY